MSKHTPGPWCQDKWGSLQTADGRDVLLRGVTTLGSGSDERIAEAEANTRLISAAPELLEALRELLSVYEGTVRSAHCQVEADNETVDMARAAIAKATGQ